MFKLVSHFEPKGDQPHAIGELFTGLKDGLNHQVLLGVTGSGKTFTMANVIAKYNKPALILAHNKTLAAQLYQEFKTFFPHNAVEYFVSYYDYYQPEAYIARTDTYIEKDLAINEEIERMRLSATRALIERSDVIIVASVSCIYGLGLPEYYKKMQLQLKKRERRKRDDILLHLVEMHYKRSDLELKRATFRSRGDVLEIASADEEDKAYRIEFFDDEIEKISCIDPLTGRVLTLLEEVAFFPGSHYVTPEEVRLRALESILKELEDRMHYFESQGELAEKDRINERTKYDMEMIKEIGFCKGIENYSRHFSERSAGDPPPCLLDYFPSEYILFIDESHQTLPQLHAMYNGDKGRKKSLVEYGFRLPSAFDNRPLKFEEIFERLDKVIYVSATPSHWEVEKSENRVIRQVIRPTGLLDPVISVRPASTQVDDCLEEIRVVVGENKRVLVTTLTKKLSEDLTKYLTEIGIKAKFLHSEIDTLKRVQIIKELRLGIFDVLVGINLLREGLDIPEVALVAILDADKQGFLRSATALIQTCGRAARNVEGRVIMYADKITDAIRQANETTEDRRKIQIEYNELHHIVPQTVHRKIIEDLAETFGLNPEEAPKLEEEENFDKKTIHKKMKECEKKMKQAARELNFEEATHFRNLFHYYRDLELIEDHP